MTAASVRRVKPVECRLIDSFLLLTFVSFHLGSLVPCQVSASETQPNHHHEGTSPLDSVSFELTAEVHDLQTGAYMVLEEKYSAEQARGLVKQRVTYETEPGLDSRETYVVDTRANISLVRSEIKDTCASLESRDLIMRALRVDFIDFEAMSDQEHIFGTARLLHYFSRHRSELRADLSGAKYTVKNAPSLRFTKKFITPASKVPVEVSVFYTEHSLDSAHWNDALPVMLHIEWPSLETKGVLIEFSPVRFVAGDSLSDEPQSDFRLDTLAMEPASGCSEIMQGSGARIRSPWSQSDSARQPYRFSFSASVRSFAVRPTSGGHNSDGVFDVQVAYDVWLNKMRVDLRAPDEMPIISSTQIFDFALNKMTHILARPKYGKFDFFGELLDRGASPLTTGSGGGRRDGAMDERGGPIHEQFRASSTFRCANAEINSSPTRSVSFTLDNLLLGTSGEFVYLGLARVRGVRARVFEHVHTQLPFWLDAQMNPRQSSGFHELQELSQPPRRHYVTVAYFSEPTLAVPDARLLLVEVYEMGGGLGLKVIGKREISVFDFAWNLQAIRVRRPIDAGGGGYPSTSGSDLAVSLFSLINYCSEWTPNHIDGQANQESHARFEMILESADELSGVTRAWLRANVPEVRLALLSTLQLNMHLIFGLMYDVETRFIARSGASAGGQQVTVEEGKESLAVSFKVGRLPETLTKMMYLGHGRRKVGMLRWRVFSLQECFMMAAHLKFETEFAHDPGTCACFISHANNKRPDSAFQMEVAANMSIFKTLKVYDYHKITREWWLNAPLREDYQKRGLHLDLSLQERPIKFTIRRLKVHQHSANLIDGSSSAVAASPNVILGFKLQPQDGLNRRANLTVSHHHDQDGEQLAGETMTVGQCEALCQADLACKSYSYCVKGAQVECILSQADLSRPELAAKIATLARRNKTQASGANSSLELEIGGNAKILLERSRYCAIYTKRYLDYYSITSVDRVMSGTLDLIKPVLSVEECASTCFMVMLDSLLEYHNRVGDSLAKLEQKPSFGLLQQVARLKEGVRKTGCYKFHFIEASTFNALPRKARAELEALFEIDPVTDPSSDTSKLPPNFRPNNNGDKQQVAGYCALARPDSYLPAIGDRVRDQRRPALAASTYQFLVAQLYEPQYGLKMRKSQLTSAEELALDRVRQFEHSRELDADSLQTARGLLERGENSQVMTIVHEQQCARNCFTQSAGLWPQCHSFDLIQYRRNNQIHTRCLLNSLSKSRALELGRLDLIDTSHAFDADEERWHYEPKPGLLSRQTIAYEQKALPVLLQDGGNSGNNGGSPSAILLITFIALGLLAGAVLSVVVQNKRARRESVTSREAFLATD